jgi:two-component system, sensor histidine kinase RegB
MADTLTSSLGASAVPLIQPRDPSIRPVTGSHSANRKNMALLIQLRWIAVVGQIVTIVAVQYGLGIALPLAAMACVLGGLVMLNLCAGLWLQSARAVTGRSVLLVLLLDVAALTAQLWLSGGAANPFTSLYLLQVTLGAVMLNPRRAWIVVGAAAGCLALITVSANPLPVPHHGATDFFSLHLAGMLVCFALDAVLLVIFVTRVTRNLRERDAHLAALRQHAVEESHIVRMGLLATGAAHELGTPLSQISVILGDWRRLPAIGGDADLAQEMAEMQAALGRCKAILTGILLSAGQARGEGARATTVNDFMGAVVEEWLNLRPRDTLVVDNRFGAGDRPIIFDAVFKQAIFNLLDNAYEASPGRVRLIVERSGTGEAERLVVRVIDGGPGFEPQMLAQLGRPYQSSKGRPGGGLGLFLVVNVVRTLGGQVSARNLAEGGAEVAIRLPLAMLSVAGQGNGGHGAASQSVIRATAHA